MPWLYLLGALAFPPAFLLWRPRERLSQAAQRFRLGASIVVVWMLAILWSLEGALNTSPKEGTEIDEKNFSEPVRVPERDRERSNGKATPAPISATPATLPSRTPKQPGDPDEVSDKKDQDIAWNWSYDGPPDTKLTLTLGWIPGLVYAWLLLLVRRTIEAKEEERRGFVVDEMGWPMDDQRRR